MDGARRVGMGGSVTTVITRDPTAASFLVRLSLRTMVRHRGVISPSRPRGHGKSVMSLEVQVTGGI